MNVILVGTLFRVVLKGKLVGSPLPPSYGTHLRAHPLGGRLHVLALADLLIPRI